jgi:hypothetical protein
MTKMKTPADGGTSAGGIGSKASNGCDPNPPQGPNHEPVASLTGIDKATPQETIEALQIRIKAAWQKSVTSIIETGKLLLDIQKKTERGSWGKIFEGPNRPFSYRMARMLMDIAEHPTLSNVKHASVLPASWYTLFVLSKIDPKKLEEFIVNKGSRAFSVHPGLQRNGAEILLRAQNSRERIHRGQGDQYVWRGQTDLPTKDKKSQTFVMGFVDKEIDDALSEIKRLITSLKKVHDDILKKPRWCNEVKQLGDRLLMIVEPDPLSEYLVGYSASLDAIDIPTAVEAGHG